MAVMIPESISATAGEKRLFNLKSVDIKAAGRTIIISYSCARYIQILER